MVPESTDHAHGDPMHICVKKAGATIAHRFVKPSDACSKQAGGREASCQEAAGGASTACSLFELMTVIGVSPDHHHPFSFWVHRPQSTFLFARSANLLVARLLLTTVFSLLMNLSSPPGLGLVSSFLSSAEPGAAALIHRACPPVADLNAPRPSEVTFDRTNPDASAANTGLGHRPLAPATAPLRSSADPLCTPRSIPLDCPCWLRVRRRKMRSRRTRHAL